MYLIRTDCKILCSDCCATKSFLIWFVMRRILKTSRICRHCKNEMPRSCDFFVADTRDPIGVGYICLECHVSSGKGKFYREVTVSKLTPEQRTRRNERARKYMDSDKGKANQARNKASIMAAAYKHSDKKKDLSNDITKDWLVSNILNKPCTYCGSIEQIGCDRIDNKQGHTKSNVVPSCSSCNTSRRDRLTVEEMKFVSQLPPRDKGIFRKILIHFRSDPNAASKLSEYLKIFPDPGPRDK